MVNKPLIRPAISWGGSFGGVARIPLILDNQSVEDDLFIYYISFLLVVKNRVLPIVVAFRPTVLLTIAP